MPTATLTPVAGDPAAVSAAGRTLSSIAAEIGTTAAKVRALASAGPRVGVDWSGGAAIRAYARAATLPPKLDKARASYGDAGAALSAYARALAAAQADSQAAVRAADTAEVDLALAETARRQAEASDAAQAAAAMSAGQSAPPPVAPRYDTAIADAQARITRAVHTNQAAHDQQRTAAKAAAAALQQASHAGIANKNWWQHALSGVGHWASTTWTASLRFVSKTATAISALAGIAALIVAVVGIICPPLEAVAATLETISLVAAAVATVADIALAATGNGTWTAVAWDALALAPTAASTVVRKLTPAIRDLRLFKPSTIAHASTGVHSTAGVVADEAEIKLTTADSWANPKTLVRHFRDHAADVSATSIDDYASKASEFLQKALRDGCPVKIDEDGVIRVIDPSSNTFGSYTPEGATKTFYKPTSRSYWDRQPGTPAWSG